MSFLAEMLAVVIVWLSSFALCQFGVAVEHAVCLDAKSSQTKTVNRSRDAAARPVPVNAGASIAVLRGG